MSKYQLPDEPQQLQRLAALCREWRDDPDAMTGDAADLLDGIARELRRRSDAAFNAIATREIAIADSKERLKGNRSMNYDRMQTEKQRTWLAEIKILDKLC